MRKGTRITHEKTQERTLMDIPAHTAPRIERNHFLNTCHLPPLLTRPSSIVLIDQKIHDITTLSEQQCGHDKLSLRRRQPTYYCSSVTESCDSVILEAKRSDATTLRCAMRERKCVLRLVMSWSFPCYLSIHLQCAPLTRSDARIRAKRPG